MMRGAGGAMVMAVAALLVCCSADRHQEQDGGVGDHGSADQYVANGHKSGNQNGGSNLVREVRETRHFSGLVPYLVSRRFDYPSQYGAKREQWPLAAATEYGGYYGDVPKRNFDEIDRSGLDTFIRKRNFDEIDQTSMPFPYATKRFYHLYGPNYLDMPVSSFDKKRLFRPDYPMDEIDLSHFPIGSKRSLDSYPLVPRAPSTV